MFRRCSWLVLLILMGPIANADEPTKAAAVKQSAQQVADAFLKGDFGAVIDQTYPGIIKFMGGREKAIEVSEAAIKQAKDQGIVIKAYKVGEPNEFFREGDVTFVVIPTTAEATIPGGKLILKSYLLGLSSDDGKEWKFADGSGLNEKALRDAVLPKFPAGFKLPEIEKPQIIKD